MKSNHLPCPLATCLLVIGLSSCASSPESPPATAAQESEVETAEAEAPDAPSLEVQQPVVEKLQVKTLEFEVEIAAPVEKVWDVMLGPEGYTKWTAPFMAGSYFEGSWAEGERMRFLAPGGSGMVAEIAVYRPHELVSIKHIGYVWSGTEDTTSDGVRSWAPAYENYRFTSVPGGTVVTVEQDVIVSFEGFMNTTWPKALAALESLCEAD